MKTPIPKFSRALAAAASCAILLAACGGASAGTSAGTAGQTTKVVVGVQPVASNSALHLGVKQGFFKDQGLEVEFVEVPTSDASVSSLVSDTVNFATVNIVTQAAAAEKGLPVKWASTLVSSPPELVPGNSGMYVRPDSNINAWKDLEGKKVQVICLSCTSEVYTRASVDKNGGDSSKLELVVLPSADAIAALEQGRVDAIGISSGLVPTAEKAGFRRLGDYVDETARSQPLTPLAVNTAWAAQHPEAVKAFEEAIKKTAAYASEHPDEVAATIAEVYPKQARDIEAAKKIPAYFSSCFNMDAVNTMLGYAIRYNMVKSDVSVDDLFYTAASSERC